MIHPYYNQFVSNQDEASEDVDDEDLGEEKWDGEEDAGLVGGDGLEGEEELEEE